MLDETCRNRRSSSRSHSLTGNWRRAGERFQRKREIAHRMKPCFRVLFQTVIDQPFERRGDVLVGRGKLRRVFAEDRTYRVGSRFAAKGAPTGKYLVKNHAERKNV